MEPNFDIRGTKTLLIGEPGAGKTTSLTTIVEAGLELFVIVTDPNGEEALLDAMERKNLDIKRLHYQYIAAASPSWDTFHDMGKKIGLMTYEDLTKIKAGINKQDHQQFLQLIGACKNFKDDRTGEEFGAVDTWNSSRCLAVDSLSGVSTMAMDMMVGAKPIAHMGEYGVAMNAELRLIKKWVSDLKCFFVLTGHIERELDLVTGTPKIMLSALGSKNAPKIPKDFSDVILAVREGDKFSWSTTTYNVALKARTLPLSDKLPPSFQQIINSWSKRAKLSTLTPHVTP